jgi:beta-galactosidase
VTVHSATNADGERIHVVHNWSWTPVEVVLPHEMTDVLTEGDPTGYLELDPWDVRVMTG